MYNFGGPDYVCPVCLFIQGVEDERTMPRKADIVYQDDLVLVFINSKFYGKEQNHGHPIIVPAQHYENLFDIPREVAHHVMDIAKWVAPALKEVRKCEGIQIEQNNGPASQQHAFHYHMHLYVRYTDDDLRGAIARGESYVSKPEERIPYATALLGYLEEHPLTKS